MGGARGTGDIWCNVQQQRPEVAIRLETSHEHRQTILMNALTPALLADWLGRAADVFAEHRARLTQLDSAIGDGDHGENVARGFKAVVAKLPPGGGSDVGALFKNGAMTLIGTVGGASGPLLGSFFLDAGKASAGKAELTLDDWKTAFEAGVRGVAARGKAVAGDKTMLDALFPAVDALRAGGGALVPSLRAAAGAAATGAAATEPIVARKGRASYLGERSAGHRDPGAESSQLLLTALADTAESAASA